MNTPLQDAILAVIRSNPGVITLRELIAGFFQFHYSELEIRGAIITLEVSDQIAVKLTEGRLNVYLSK